MAIKKVAEYEHGNADLAFVDSSFVRGGGRSVADLDALYALSTKSDQLKQNVSMVYVVSESSVFLLTDDGNIGNANGWTDLSDVTGGGGPWVVSNNDIYNSNSGNVGIGTSTPTERLEVTGNIKLSSIGTGYSASSYDLLFYGTTTTGSQTDQAKIHSSPWVPNSNGGNLHFYTSNASNALTERMRIDGDGKVGIGTTSPATKLEVAGVTTVRKSGIATAHADTDLFVTDATAAVSTAQIEILGGNAGASTLKFADTDYYTAGSIDYSHVDDSMSFRTNNSIQATISSTGNVGIGTTSPDYKLDVSGEVRADAYRIDLSATTQRALSSTGTDSLQIGDAGVNDIRLKNAAGTSLILNSSGNVGIGTISPAVTLDVASDNPKIRLTDTDGGYAALEGNLGNLILIADAGDSRDSSRMAFKVDGGEVMRIDSSGNVGIGTTSPTEKLHVDGNIRVGDSSDTVFCHRFQAFANAHVYLVSNSGYDLKFSAGGTEKMVVEDSGNVGIGTTSPTHKLHVVGQIKVDDGSSPYVLPGSDGNTGQVLTTDGNGVVTWGAGGGGGGGGLWSANGSDIYYNSGNVGIGTTSPSTKLDVSGGDINLSLGNYIRFGGQLGIKKESNGAMHFYAGTNVNSGGFDFATWNGSTYNGGSFVIRNNGNVGIGTTSPAQKLHVSGRARVDQNSQALDLIGTDHVYSAWYPRGTASGRKAYMGYAQASVTDFTAMNQDTGSFIIGTNNLERVRIDSSGNVGIGTTSPDHLLHVAGNAKISNIYLLDSIIHEGDVDTKIKFSTDTIAFHTAGSERLTINSSGNLTVAGRADFQYDLRLRGTDSAANLGIVRFYADSSNALYIDTANDGSNLFTINSSGNVGIRTTSPAYALHVNSGGVNQVASFESTDGNAHIELKDSSGSSFWTRSSGRTSIGSVLSDSTSNLNILDSGNVGIGTTSPSEKLDVVGLANINDGSENVMISSYNTTLAASPDGWNTAVGSYAGYSLSTGQWNTALGAGSLVYVTSGSENTSVGYSSLYDLTTGHSNVGVGRNTLQRLTTGSNNVAVGSYAARGAVDGGAYSFSNTVAVGYQALYGLTNGIDNTAVGYRASFSLTTGNYNVSLGNLALYGNQTGLDNTAIGYAALYQTTNSNNTAVGLSAGSNITGSGNTAIGWRAGEVNNIENTVIGREAGRYTTGSYNVGIGKDAAKGVSGSSTFSNTVAVGYQALTSLTTGANNTATGYQAGFNLKTGAYNVSLGNYALRQNQIGEANTALGYGALYSATYSNNTAVGYLAAYSAGSNNAALGSRALNYTTGSYNVAVGFQAAQGVSSESTFSNTVAIGYQASYSLTEGDYNVSLGNFALYGNQTGDSNTAIGHGALRETTGSGSTAVGYQSMLNSTIGDNNTAVGYQSLFDLTTADDNTAIGYRASANVTTGAANVSLGGYALYTNQTGTNNTGIGYGAIYQTTSSNNTAVGHLAAYNGGESNSAFGAFALLYTTGNNNVAIGREAARGVSESSTFSNTVAVGYQALTALTTGASNTALGYRALASNMIGSNNVAVGNIAGVNIATANNTVMGFAAGSEITGNSNIAIGFRAGEFNNNENTVIGREAGRYTTGNYNVAIGKDAAQGVDGSSTFSNTVAVGYQAGAGLTTGGSNVLIGYQAGSTLTIESNKLYIENSNSSTPLIYGEFDNNLVRINGELQVGDPASTGFKLPTTDGSASQVLSTDGSGTVTWATVSGSGVDTTLASSDLTQSAFHRIYTLNGNSSSSLAIKSGENKNVFSFADAGGSGSHVPQSTAFGSLWVKESDTSQNDAQIQLYDSSGLTTTIKGNMGTASGSDISGDTSGYKFLVKDTSDPNKLVKELSFDDLVSSIVLAGIDDYIATYGGVEGQFQNNGVTGDFDGDGLVGSADLLAFLTTYGQSSDGIYNVPNVEIRYAPTVTTNENGATLPFDSDDVTVTAGTIAMSFDYVNDIITWEDNASAELAAYPNKTIQIQLNQATSSTNGMFEYTPGLMGQNISFYMNILLYSANGTLVYEQEHLINTYVAISAGNTYHSGINAPWEKKISDLYNEQNGSTVTKIQVYLKSYTTDGEAVVGINKINIKLLQN